MKWSGWRWLIRTASSELGSIALTSRGNDPWPRSRRIAASPARTRYEAPDEPGRSDHAGPAPSTDSSNEDEVGDIGWRQPIWPDDSRPTSSPTVRLRVR